MPDTTETVHPPPGGEHALIENFPNGVLVLFDDELRYRIVGPEILPFSKRAAAEMVGRRFHELFPEETVRELEPELQATIDGESRSIDIEFEDRIHHIETRPAEIDGEPYGVLVTQGVTAEREMAAQLQRQNERLDQFASMVSHDLRNPLAVASSNLELYRETGDDSRLEAVESALQRIDDLTEDLLTVVQTGGEAADFEEISLADVATQAWESIETRSASVELDDRIVTGDEGQLRALFENLFRNAVGHGGNAVTVRVGPLTDGFFVEDTGEGIPAEKRTQVFDHGFSTGYGGSGIGLTVVSRIAQAHGWEITLVESNEGGARFEFRRGETDQSNEPTRS